MLFRSLGERTEIDPARMKGRATRDAVVKAFGDIGARAKANDEVFILLIGHGSFDGRTAAFNLPGPEHRDQQESLDLVRKLAARGADLNARLTREPRDGNRQSMKRAGATPFLLATKALDLPYMQLLLDLGADPKLATDEGTNALMAAAGVGQGFASAGQAPGSIDADKPSTRLNPDGRLSPEVESTRSPVLVTVTVARATTSVHWASDALASKVS